MASFGLAVLSLALLSPGVPQPTVGASADLAARTDVVFAAFDRADAPGCAVGVVRDGEIAYARGYGLANLEWRAPITARTVFDVGSISKQFTAAAVILLAAEGKLSLDDDVRKWVPEVPDFGRRITLRQLVHHTSGLRDAGSLLWLAGFSDEDVVREEDILEMTARQRRLNADPGAEFAYCNTGYTLLSVVARRAGGKTLRALAQERIFGPLGMTSTRFLDDHAEVVPNRAAAYESAGEGRFRAAPSNTDYVGDGAVLTTVEDLARWQRNFSEPRIGPPSFVDAMLEPATLSDGKKLGYASALFVGELGGRPTVRHRGLAGGYRADVLRFPEQRLDVIVLCNHGDAEADALSERVADVWLGGGVAAEPASALAPAAVAARDLPARAGRYRDPASGEQRVLVARDGKLFVSLGGADREIVPAADGGLEVDQPTWKTRVAFDGPRLRWIPALGRAAVLERFEPEKPTGDRLRAFVGRYRSEELGAEWTLSFEDGALVRRARPGRATPLEPATRDELRSGRAVLRFRRDARGRPVAFTLSYGVIRDIEFTRVAP